MSVPEYIKTIVPYKPGKPVEELERELGIKEAVKLASNENPLGPSPKAVEAITKALSGINRYPDGGAYYLRHKLAEKLKVRPEEIIFGNGSNEILDIAVRTFMTPEDEAVMAEPSFVVYPLAVQCLGGRAIKVPLTEGDLRHDLKAMADAITEKTKIVFIANPNNPTGTIVYSDEFKTFMERVPEGVLVVVDEAYYEYVQDSRYPDTMEYFRQGRDILIVRTFSKAYGLAGLRIGYAIAKEELITEMNKVREPFNTGTLAQVAAMAALDDEEHLRRSIEVNEKGKAFLYGAFKELGLQYVPTETNFIFVVFNEPIAMELYEKLLREGVIVRPMGQKALRITIGLEDENLRLIEALKKVL
ncbi:MAG: histidinol-phosphate transaminase [Nitrospirae bacterium]|nr:MAG: histidinol-phosphate transaminase [Nitrospirota bacterium]